MERVAKIEPKKPYTTPTLWVHGGFEELTKTSMIINRSQVDGRGISADRRTF